MCLAQQVRGGGGGGGAAEPLTPTLATALDKQE